MLEGDPMAGADVSRFQIIRSIDLVRDGTARKIHQCQTTSLRQRILPCRWGGEAEISLE